MLLNMTLDLSYKVITIIIPNSIKLLQSLLQMVYYYKVITVMITNSMLLQTDPAFITQSYYNNYYK